MNYYQYIILAVLFFFTTKCEYLLFLKPSILFIKVYFRKLVKKELK